jgi:hypothetical protein
MPATRRVRSSSKPNPPAISNAPFAYVRLTHPGVNPTQISLYRS